MKAFRIGDYVDHKSSRVSHAILGSRIDAQQGEIIYEVDGLGQLPGSHLTIAREAENHTAEAMVAYVVDRYGRDADLAQSRQALATDLGRLLEIFIQPSSTDLYRVPYPWGYVMTQLRGEYRPYPEATDGAMQLKAFIGGEHRTFKVVPSPGNTWTHLKEIR